MKKISILSFLSVSAVLACSMNHEDEVVGSASVAITSVPTDVGCIRLTARGARDVERSFDVSPGTSSVLTLTSLPVGSVSFSGAAFSGACSAVSSTTVPGWVAEPVVGTVTSSGTVSVDLFMKRNGRASVTVDFESDDAGAGDAGTDGASDADTGSSTCPMYWPDADGDGFGAAGATPIASCSPIAGYVTAGGDCNDANAQVNPSKMEIAGDGVDQNCDGRELCFVDVDGDGFRSPSVTVLSSDTDCNDFGEAKNSTPVDCNDANATINPGRVEVPGDGVDSNCDGTELCYADADGDGARTATTMLSMDSDCSDPGEATGSSPLDCNDTNASMYPGATDPPFDGIDQNCDGVN